jgi:Kef-type K+ transport system membrane component KefB/mannitol/fructose-specific phosphotransferase system IIA component (Ntr-type)
MHYLNEHNVYIFLVQVFILLGAARVAGEMFRRFGQPAVIAEILVGIILGPTIFGRVAPDLFMSIFPADPVQRNMLETAAWIGILLFLLNTGLELDFSSAWRQKGDALMIAFSDIIVPFSLAFALSFFIPPDYLVSPDKRVIFAVFIATVMTISALPITARILSELNLYKTDLGFLIMCALSVNDIIGWLLFTVALSLFRTENPDLTRMIIVCASAVGFTGIALSLGRRFSDKVMSWIRNRNFPQQGASLTFICLLGMICGIITLKIGIQALFGFFVAGVIAGEARALSERTRNVISQMVHAVFVPLFFANIGLKLDFAGSLDLFLIIFVLGISVSAKYIGVRLGIMFTRQSRSNWSLIAIAHTPGGEMQIVVGMLALQYGLIKDSVFVAIVFGAMISSLLVGPWMAHALRKRREINMTEFFSRRAVIPELKPKERDSVLAELCAKAAEQDNMPREEVIYQAVLKRENAMGTAIEEGVAIPHARLEHLSKSLVVFARSAAGIEWNSPDGKPTNFIFLVLTPQKEDEVQLQILRSIAMTMGDGSIRERLHSSRGGDEIWDALHSKFTQHQVVRKSGAIHGRGRK